MPVSKQAISIVLAIVALLAVGAFAAQGLLVQHTGPVAPGFPPLPDARASCPAQPQHAAHAARAALQAAHARMQRYAFAPSDGRRAVERMAIASECARLAGDGALERAATEQRQSLRARIERDARDHFQRYEHLKRQLRLKEAADDIAYLIELGWPVTGPLADQLRRDRDTVAGDAVEARR